MEMIIKMKKFGLLVIPLYLLFISGCSSFNANYKANQLHDKGDYLTSTITLVDYLKNNTDTVPPKKMVNLINSNVQQIQKQINSLATSDYDTKIRHYKDLRTITLAIENANLPHKPANLTNPPLNLIDITLAEIYYLKGNAITPIKNEDYLSKAQIYREGLQFYRYKNMQQLMEENQYTYSINLAEEYYQKAVLDIKITSYQRASEYLEKCINAYQSYGNYKDSKQLLAKYDPIWRKEKANNLYNQATGLINNANSTAELKRIRDYFEESYQVYSRYGSFKDSQSLANKYDHEWRKSLANDYYVKAESYHKDQTKKGYRKAAEYYQLANEAYSHYGSFKDSSVLTQQMTQQGIINVGHSLYGYSGIDKAVLQAIESSFSHGEFNINRGTIDFFIQPNLSVKTDVIDKIISERDIVKDQYNYKEIKKLNKRTYIIDGNIRINGKLYEAQSFNIEKVSWVTHTYYEGNYPKKLSEKYDYENAKYGSEIKSESELADDALYELQSELTRYFNTIRQKAINDL